jgi:hypothetical protein
MIMMRNEEGRKGARHLRDELMVLTMDTGLPLWGPGAGCIKSGYIRGSFAWPLFMDLHVRLQ